MNELASFVICYGGNCSYKIFLIICFVTATSLAKRTSSNTTLVQVLSANRHEYPHLRNKLYASILSSSTCVNISSWPQWRRTAHSHSRTRAAPIPDRRYPRFTHRFSITGRRRAVLFRSRSLLVDVGCWDISNLSSITSQHPTISSTKNK